MNPSVARNAQMQTVAGHTLAALAATLDVVEQHRLTTADRRLCFTATPRADPHFGLGSRRELPFRRLSLRSERGPLWARTPRQRSAALQGQEPLPPDTVTRCHAWFVSGAHTPTLP